MDDIDRQKAEALANQQLNDIKGTTTDACYHGWGNTGVCPRCGYCPYCGRAWGATPWYPYPGYPQIYCSTGQVAGTQQPS